MDLGADLYAVTDQFLDLALEAQKVESVMTLVEVDQ